MGSKPATGPSKPMRSFSPLGTVSRGQLRVKQPESHVVTEGHSCARRGTLETQMHDCFYTVAHALALRRGWVSYLPDDLGQGWQTFYKGLGGKCFKLCRPCSLSLTLALCGEGSCRGCVKNE